MNNWNPSAHYHKVAEANRQYYTKTAQTYEATETCLTDNQAQQMLEADIDRIIGLANKPPDKLQVLDACGGSGNISLKLLSRGINVTTCDLSMDLLHIFQDKCTRSGYTPKIVCSEISNFLMANVKSYDLIVFSSALHHLENIEGVLSLAFESLKPAGFLFTVFDPTLRTNKLTNMIMWMDYIAFKIHKQPDDLIAAMIRRMRRTLQNFPQGHRNDKHTLDISDANMGVLAEYHIEQGIDDIGLVAQLQQIGFEVVWHDRYPGTRYAFTRSLLRLLNDVTAFKLLLTRTPFQNRVEL